nr:phage tail protein [Moraxella sp. CTOTU48268]
MKTFTWDIDASSSENTAYSVNKVQFGDGYEQVSSFGINNKRKTWQCSKQSYKSTIDDIYNFLGSTQAVEPFYFQPIKTEQGFTVRLVGEVSRQKIGGDVWKISFNLEQAFI